MKTKNRKRNDYKMSEAARELGVCIETVQAWIYFLCLESYELEKGDHRVTRKALDVFKWKREIGRTYGFVMAHCRRGEE